MSVDAAFIPKNDFQGGIEPASGNHFICGFLADAVIFLSLHSASKIKKAHWIGIQQAKKNKLFDSVV
jgi:hypothetical protein